MKCLVNADVLGEPTKSAPHPGVVEWLRHNEREIVVDPVILGEAGLRWAALLASLRVSGRTMPIQDSLIAATALVHDLVVVARNRADFEKAGLDIVDPFAA